MTALGGDADLTAGTVIGQDGRRVAGAMVTMEQPDLESETAGQQDIEIRLAAVPANLPMLRSLAAAIAVSQDFDIDTMADLRMAVDELCATVITRAAGNAQLSCRFTCHAGTVAVSASARAASQEPLDRSSFGWMVLESLAESVAGSVQLDDGGQAVHLQATVRQAQVAP